MQLQQQYLFNHRVILLPRVKWCLLGMFLTLMLFTVACSTAWTTQAIQIVDLLVPAIQSALAILALTGVKLAPDALSAVQKWGNESTYALQNVIKPLIDQYSTAVASAQPGILAEIETAVSTITNNLQTILPTLHVEDAATQEKITAVVDAVASELTALTELIPVLKGQHSDLKRVKELVAKALSPEEFRESYNSAAGEFGDQYKI